MAVSGKARAIPALAAAGWLLASAQVAGQVAGDSGGLVISALPVLPRGGEVIEAGEAGPAAMPPTAMPPAAHLVALPDEAALPRAPGLPEPSVILGDLAVLLSMAERGPRGVPRLMRENIRQRDIAIFQRLLAGGAFDPDGDQLAAALQTELAQMNCYDGQIDGDWGAGSAAALGRYVQASGAGQAGAEPDIALFRQIAGYEPVHCADRQPVAASTPAAPSGPSQTAGRASGAGATGGGASGAAAAARAPAQVQAPAETGQRQISPGLIGSGMFR